MAYSWLLLVVYLAMIASAVGRLCQTIEGQFTFFNPGIKDFILCPNERAACSTVGGKKAQRSCEFCCDNNRTKTQKNGNSFTTFNTSNNRRTMRESQAKYEQ